MDLPRTSSRRTFMRLTSGAALAGGGVHTLAARVPPSGRIAANDRIRIATIGAGGKGMSDTRTALGIPGVELVAVADLYDGRRVRARELWGDRLFTTRDYREVLARPDVDAVIIGTSDHWHMQVAVDAMRAGKDVYCEKPMVQALDQGQQVIDAAAATGRILQVGSQRVSSVVYAKAKELIASGAIGELNLVEAWWDRNTALGAWQYSIPPDASPETVDWGRFLGGAPKVPFDPKRFFRWRNYRDYGTGVSGDLFVHLFSGLHFVTGAIGPDRVMATGGLRYWNDGRDVPDVMLGLYDYPKTERHPAFNVALRVDFAAGSAGSATSSGFRFVGNEGVLTLDGSVTVSRLPRSKEPGYTINTFPKAMQSAILADYRARYPEDRHEIRGSREEVYAPPANYNDSIDHFANFFAAVRTRQPVVEDARFGFRAAGPALLTNRSYFERRAFGWDPEAMKVVEG